MVSKQDCMPNFCAYKLFVVNNFNLECKYKFQKFGINHKLVKD